MSARQRGRRGIALVLTILVLAALSALVAAEWFVALQEARIGEGTSSGVKALSLAEEGVVEIVHDWVPAGLRTSLPYPLDSVAVPAGFPGAWEPGRHATGAYGAHIYRLNGELSLIDVVARDSTGRGGTPGRQRVGLLVRVRPLDPHLRAALTAGQRVRTAGRVSVDGADKVPPGWSGCGPPDSTRAGLLVASGSSVAAPVPAVVTGTPPIASDSATAQPLTRLGDVTVAQLVGAARGSVGSRDLLGTIGPAVVSGKCDETVATNRGDGVSPSSPCGTYFPVTYVPEAVTIHGVGEGILLVDGDLTIDGPTQWFGAVIVRGSVRVHADQRGDVAVWGAIVAQDSVLLDAPDGLSSIAVQYSKCPIIRALEPVSTVGALRSRGWMMLF